MRSSTLAQDQDARWIAPGGGYRKRTVCHDETYQTVRLQASGVDPSHYGAIAESGLFGLDCFDSMVDAGCNIDGYVFLSQTYRLIRAPSVGEKLEIDGYVRDLAETSRGQVANEIYRFSDSEGRVCLESELTGLLALPHGVTAEGAPALPRREAQPADGWEMIQEKHVTPDDVRLFFPGRGQRSSFRCGVRPQARLPRTDRAGHHVRCLASFSALPPRFHSGSLLCRCSLSAPSLLGRLRFSVGAQGARWHDWHDSEPQPGWQGDGGSDCAVDDDSNRR